MQAYRSSVETTATLEPGNVEGLNVKLFTVETTAPECHGYKDVRFEWFHVGSRTPRRPYHLLIEDYDPSDPNEDNAYNESCIDELFTALEAEMLKSHLEQEYQPSYITPIKEVILPIASNSMCWIGWPEGGRSGFYKMSEEQGYPLPFKVWGYFNLKVCEFMT